jgi:Ner family transcriptional regulator
MSATARLYHAPEDWHPADIVAAVRKAGWSFARLALAAGYHTRSLQMVGSKAWPNAEVLIAAAISSGSPEPVHAWDIWPSRWEKKGRRWVPRRGELTLQESAARRIVKGHPADNVKRRASN